MRLVFCKMCAARILKQTSARKETRDVPAIVRWVGRLLRILNPHFAATESSELANTDAVNLSRTPPETDSAFRNRSLRRGEKAARGICQPSRSQRRFTRRLPDLWRQAAPTPRFSLLHT